MVVYFELLVNETGGGFPPPAILILDLLSLNGVRFETVL